MGDSPLAAAAGFFRFFTLLAAASAARLAKRAAMAGVGLENAAETSGLAASDSTSASLADLEKWI